MMEERRRGREDADRDLLTPESAPVEWERVVRTIVSSAAPELRRRRSAAAAPVPQILLARWARPLLAAAATVMLLAVGALLWGGGGAGSSGLAGLSDEVSGLEDALYPPLVARWVGEDARPTVEEIAYSSPVDGASVP